MNGPRLLPGFWFVLATLVVSPGGVRAQDQMFYRLMSAESSERLGLSSAGTLTWNCSQTGGTYVIERSRGIPSLNWAPFARGTAAGAAMSLRVFDRATPPGMVFIPSGSFTMGDILNDGAYARPVHTA